MPVFSSPFSHRKRFGNASGKAWIHGRDLASSFESVLCDILENDLWLGRGWLGPGQKMPSGLVTRGV